MDLPNQIIVTQMKAGEHASSMAGQGEIIIDVQYLPHEKFRGLGGNVKREVEEHIAAVCHADPYLRKRPARIEWILDAGALPRPPTIPLSRLFNAPFNPPL